MTELTGYFISDKIDLFICYATAPGNFAIRDSGSGDGSPFIKALCKQMAIKKRQSMHQDSSRKYNKLNTVEPDLFRIFMAQFWNDLSILN